MNTGKPGWQTTEFWVTVIAVLTPWLQSITGIDVSASQGDIAEAIAGIISAWYVAARAITKVAHAPKRTARRAPVTARKNAA